MLHELGAHRFSNAFTDQQPQSENQVLCYHEDLMLVREQDELRFPTVAEMGVLAEELGFLFTLDEQPLFLCTAAQEFPLDGFKWTSVWEMRYSLPEHLAFAGITGHHLYRWYLSHRFCGACGGRMARDKVERMLFCASCGQKEYPHIMPAVIVGIVHGESLLMTKYAGRTNPRWALVAGFTEIGETLEETVVREVMEETGLQVTDVTYYKSQPWPFSGSLLSGYFARVVGEPTIQRDTVELSEAVFVDRKDIDVVFDGKAMTNEMICCFRDHGPQAVLHRDPLRQDAYKSLQQ